MVPKHSSDSLVSPLSLLSPPSPFLSPLSRDYLAVPENHKTMLNPLYEKNTSVLLITVTALNVTLWRQLYLRTDALEELDLPGYDALRLLKEENLSRQEKLKEVKRYYKN